MFEAWSVITLCESISPQAATACTLFGLYQHVASGFCFYVVSFSSTHRTRDCIANRRAFCVLEVVGARGASIINKQRTVSINDSTDWSAVVIGAIDET